MWKTTVKPSAGLALLPCLLLLSCTDSRPTWSLSEGVIDQLAGDPWTSAAADSPPGSVARGCRALLTLRLDQELPAGATAAWLHASLRRARQIAVSCIGACGEGAKCAVHHSIRSLDPRSAETSCTCEPRRPPPCRLVVTWVPGREARRRIERVSCGRDDPAGSCEWSLLPADGELEIGCRPGRSGDPTVH